LRRALLHQGRGDHDKYDETTQPYRKATRSSPDYLNLLPPTSEAASAKGTVKALTTSKNVSNAATLADIEWDVPGLSKRLNIINLVKIKN
jgi:hypothetical protein